MLNRLKNYQISQINDYVSRLEKCISRNPKISLLVNPAIEFATTSDFAKYGPMTCPNSLQKHIFTEICRLTNSNFQRNYDNLNVLKMLVNFVDYFFVSDHTGFAYSNLKKSGFFLFTRENIASDPNFLRDPEIMFLGIKANFEYLQKHETEKDKNSLKVVNPII